MKLLIVAPSLNGEDVGEVYSIFKLVEALSKVADVTVLASSRKHMAPLAEQLADARVVTWPEPEALYTRFERFNAMAKPWLPVFNRKVQKWIRDSVARGERFDVAHQLLPQAMRYASSLRGFDIPYAIGPLGGGLSTPEEFRKEVGTGGLVTRLRAVDSFRLRYDPKLRKTYERAGILFGVAPYVEQNLLSANIEIRNFQTLLERGHGDLPDERVRQAEVGKLELLHVGRTIRTKGLRDVIRALAHLGDLPGVKLTSAGAGPDLANCKIEADRLGVADRVSFLGRISRDEVEHRYADADVFCFPSFREPMGGVFFEAMAHGLPIITAARGGPDYIVNESAGLRVNVQNPDQFARDIAAAIRELALDPKKRVKLGKGARERLISFGTWEDKAQKLLNCYRQMVTMNALGFVEDD